MLWEEQKKLFTELVAKESDLLLRKGAEYASDADALDNFKRGAAEVGIDPKQILWVYLSKHLASIKSYVRKGKVISDEPIDGRIQDARNYLFLLSCLIAEEQPNVARPARIVHAHKLEQEAELAVAKAELAAIDVALALRGVPAGMLDRADKIAHMARELVEIDMVIGNPRALDGAVTRGQKISLMITALAKQETKNQT